MSQILIAAIGNPVLDITSTSDEETLQKFGLEFGRTVFINKQNEGFFNILESQKEVHYIPGGSITNSIRITKVINILSFLVDVGESYKL
jgi:hypothetical protein